MNKFLALLFFLMLSCSPLRAQSETVPPPEGKAVVYIGKLESFFGAARPFHIFHGEEYLVRMKGKKYLRYVVDPGEHLFWVAADNRAFIKADLEEGRSYALYAKMQVGTWSGAVSLQSITKESKAWKEFGKMIQKKKSVTIDHRYIEKWKKNKPDYVSKVMEEWKAEGEPAGTVRKDEYFE